MILQVSADNASLARIREYRRAAGVFEQLALSSMASDPDKALASAFQEHLLMLRSIEHTSRKKAAESTSVGAAKPTQKKKKPSVNGRQKKPAKKAKKSRK